MRIYFARAREATAVASGSLATVSGEKQGVRVRFGGGGQMTQGCAHTGRMVCFIQSERHSEFFRSPLPADSNIHPAAVTLFFIILRLIGEKASLPTQVGAHISYSKRVNTQRPEASSAVRLPVIALRPVVDLLLAEGENIFF